MRYASIATGSRNQATAICANFAKVIAEDITVFVSHDHYVSAARKKRSTALDMSSSPS
jgi:hypothetical protein